MSLYYVYGLRLRQEVVKYNTFYGLHITFCYLLICKQQPADLYSIGLQRKKTYKHSGKKCS
jgi:hypothetical protein